MKAFLKITILFLVLLGLNACKKDVSVDATTSAITGCKISKIDNDSYSYIDYFVYNSSGQVSEYHYEYKDTSDKSVRSVCCLYL